MSLKSMCAEELFKLAEETLESGRISEELSFVSSCLKDHQQYIRLLEAASIPLAEKLRLIDAAFQHVHPYIRNTLKLLAERRRVHLFAGCAAEYRRIYEKAAGIAEASLTLPFMPDDDTMEKLRLRLEEVSWKKLEIQLHIKPTLIGGAVREMDGQRFDNSIRTKLRRVYTHMAGNRTEE